MRFIVLSVSFLSFFALAAPAAAQITGALQPTPTLKRAATVSSDLVRIGDLVENAGSVADIAIFRAPDLGQTGTVQTYRVLDAVRSHGLLVVDTKGISEVAVARASRVIPVKEIESLIIRAIMNRYGLADSSRFIISFDRDARAVNVEPTAEGALQLTRFLYDPRSGRFEASFDLPGSPAAARINLRYTGTAIETVEVAMLTRSLGRGEMLKPSDVSIERRPKSELGSTEMISSAAEVVGLATRRALRVGQPLRVGDLMRPELVQRGEAVTLVYQVPGMMVTTRGKALESGAAGDTVNVLNIQSKRTVQGTVTGPGRVSVAATTPLAFNVPAAPRPSGANLPATRSE